ncbi:MAG: hypothetical protein RRY23_00065 [Alistipes sp.]
MKPQELRIGNIVAINNPKSHPFIVGVALRVTGIHENSNGYVVNLEHINKEPDTYYESYCQKIEFVEPIPITEELLLKCGFVKADGFYYTCRCPFTLWSDPFDGSYNALSGTDYIAREINYLQQLQNLYFILTNKELKAQFEEHNINK